jgi:hypothetical protein
MAARPMGQTGWVTRQCLSAALAAVVARSSRAQAAVEVFQHLLDGALRGEGGVSQAWEHSPPPRQLC